MSLNKGIILTRNPLSGRNPGFLLCLVETHLHQLMDFFVETLCRRWIQGGGNVLCSSSRGQDGIGLPKHFHLNERLEGLAVLGKVDEIYLHIVGNLSNSRIKSALGGSWLADEKHWEALNSRIATYLRWSMPRSQRMRGAIEGPIKLVFRW